MVCISVRITGGACSVSSNVDIHTRVLSLHLTSDEGAAACDAGSIPPLKRMPAHANAHTCKQQSMTQCKCNPDCSIITVTYIFIRFFFTKNKPLVWPQPDSARKTPPKTLNTWGEGRGRGDIDCNVRQMGYETQQDLGWNVI